MMSRFGLALAAGIVLLLVVRGVIAARLGLTDDEAYYRLWSLVPAASYLDHPPMVGWWIAAGRWLAGDTPLAVRLVSLVAYVVGTAAVWRAATLLFDAATARIATLFTLAMPLMGVGTIVITPDAPTVTCWALTVWGLAELTRSQNANWWLAVGVFAGLGLLSKYTNLFLGAGILLWLLAVPSLRRWFAAWQLWGGGAIALACAAPVVAWNAEHDWALFAKQFGRVTRGQSLTGAYILEMVGGFIALASPIIAGLALFGLYLMSQRTTRERPVAEALIVALIVPALCYFLVHGLHSRVQANWLAPLYPLLAICAAYAVTRWLAATASAPLTTGAAGLGFVMTGFVYWHALSPLDAGQLRRDPTDQMRGWVDMAAEIEKVRRATGAQWIATSSYATTGQLAFALRDGTHVYQLNERIRYVHLPAPAADVVSEPALYVELERRQAPHLLAQAFNDVKKLPNVVRRGEGKDLSTYAVYRVARPKFDPFSPAR